MMSRELRRCKPFAFLTVASKWSRLNHALAAFGNEHLFVGWPCFLSRPGTSSPPALSGIGLIRANRRFPKFYRPTAYRGDRPRLARQAPSLGQRAYERL